MLFFRGSRETAIYIDAILKGLGGKIKENHLERSQGYCRQPNHLYYICSQTNYIQYIESTQCANVILDNNEDEIVQLYKPLTPILVSHYNGGDDLVLRLFEKLIVEKDLSTDKITILYRCTDGVDYEYCEEYYGMSTKCMPFELKEIY